MNRAPNPASVEAQNLATGRWDPHHPPENWKQVRNRWEFVQGPRSWLLLAGFVLTAAGFAIS